MHLVGLTSGFERSTAPQRAQSSPVQAELIQPKHQPPVTTDPRMSRTNLAQAAVLWKKALPAEAAGHGDDRPSGILRGTPAPFGRSPWLTRVLRCAVLHQLSALCSR